MKKLRDLNPAFERDHETEGRLSFDCPCARPDCERRINGLPTIDGPEGKIVRGRHRWGLTGSPPDWDSVSLHPSVNYDEGHWHGFIQQGEAR